MPNKRIYVAGPYRAASEREKTKNILRARQAAQKLCEQGHFVFCPHANTAYYDNDLPQIPDDFWLLMGETFLRYWATAIYMMRGWEQSKGACQELKLAQELGLEIIYEDTKYPGIEFGKSE